VKVLILAGGSGIRLWPLSRQDFPKQFLSFNDPLSLLQKTVQRFLNAPFVEEILVMTNEAVRQLVELQLAKIDPSQRVTVLIEPMRRSTLGATLLGVKYFEEKTKGEEDSAILVIPSDQLIEPESVFLRYLEEVEPFTKKDRIILFGIHPQRPETGYGYIQIGEKEEGLLYDVKRFVEKPDHSLAKEYLASGDYYWNAGIFAFSPRVFWREIKSHMPKLYECMQGSFSSCLAHFSDVPDQSIDYAILEKTKNISVCPLPISWSDIGSWDGLYEALSKDHNQNVKMGNVLEIDTKNSLLLGGRRLISTIGLDDVLVVETEDATFISKKGESQKVKELVQELVRMGRLEERHHWGSVKQIYSDAGFRIVHYRIRAMQAHSHEVECSLEHWCVLKGEIYLKTKDRTVVLKSSESSQFKQSESLTISNHLGEEAEVMSIEFANELR
jgi:mannose-1-phosphate guanylyltransferase/mannose-6-phosphate isomerase